MAGCPETPQCVVIGPPVPPSHQQGQVTLPASIDLLSVSRRSSVLTLTTANGLPSYLAWSARSLGYIATQGRHHSPENTSRTTLPRKSLSLNRFPSTSAPSIS